MNNDDGDDGDGYAVGDVFFHRRETNESNHDSLPPETPNITCHRALELPKSW